MLDKDTSLAEKLWMLFWEQGITIASIHTAIGMAIGVLVEVLLASGVGLVAQQVSLYLRTKKVRKNESSTNLKPQHCY